MNNFNTENKINLLALIKEMTTNKKLENKTLKALVSITCQYAISYLSTKYTYDRLKFINLGFTFDEIANDAIIPLLLKNNKTNEIGIVKSFKDWKSPIETEAQAEYFFYRISTNRVEQEITRILREADPYFSKILNAVNYVIEKNNWRKITFCGTVYIVNKKIGTNKRFIKSDEFDSIQSKLFFGNPKKVINNLLDHLKNETEYYCAIPLNSLVKRLKYVQMENYNGESKNNGFENEERLDIDSITNKALNFVLSRLDQFYFKKEKITDEEKEIFIKILKELARDIKNGGQSRGLILYMKSYMPDLTDEKFYQKYHQILDYLFRVLKSEIARHIKMIV